MNRQLSTVIVLLGLVAAIYLGVKYYGKQHRAASEARQKEAFESSLVADQVVCDDCGALSKLNVPFKDKYSFQVCPACGQKKARPVVYFYCMRPECNRRLFQFIGHVWGENGFSPSPMGAPKCPSCELPDKVIGEPVTLVTAKQIAEETNQPFPPKD